MNATELLAMYERVADAPDAVGQLRRFVLDLAVRGKLVEQDATEEPVSRLLREVARRRETLEATGANGRRDSLPDALPKNAAFALPTTWQWVRFGNLVEFAAGRTPSRSDPMLWNSGDYPWVSIADMRDGETLISTRESVSTRSRQSVFRSEPVPPGTILMSFKLTIGKIVRLGVPAYHNEAIISIRPYVADLEEYLFLVLPQRAREGDTKGAIKGSTLNRHSIANILVPLPPLAEQHRIVAKVDELMALFDELDAARTEREAARDRLAAASLARLNAPAPDTFQADARFALNVLPALSTRPDQVKQLRQTILNLAVRGKLVPQIPNDEPIARLLVQLGTGWERARCAGPSDERQLPAQWEFALLEHCFSVTGGLQKTPARAPKLHAYPYLSVANVHRGRIDLTSVKKFEVSAVEVERFQLRAQDILVVEGNGSASEIGRCAVWTGEIEVCVHQNHLIRCRPLEVALTPYAALFLNSPKGMAGMRLLAITSAGLFSLSVGKIRKILLPLPPIAEQDRIVEKVGELIALCDQLDASLATGESTRSRLLNAMLQDALQPMATIAA